MPNYTCSLSDGAAADLQSISEERGDDSVETTLDTLVNETIARAMQASPAARQRSFEKGRSYARGQAVFSDAFVATTKVLNRGSYPSHLQRKL